MFGEKTRTVVVVGAQWGDEGKGKLVDVLAERADWVVRYQGGANAGHTVHIGETSFVLHQIPSGILHPGMHRAIKGDAAVLLEGAQGSLLDIDHGTYPYVTSSSTTSGGAAIGVGIAPTAIDAVLGVVKAYTTRVGNGPLPTEIQGALGEEIRRLGHEFGATTGRARRCGWFDALVVRYATRVNGLTGLAVTKLDVLDTLDRIALCTGYEVDGHLYEEFP